MHVTWIGVKNLACNVYYLLGVISGNMIGVSRRWSKPEYGMEPANEAMEDFFVAAS